MYGGPYEHDAVDKGIIVFLRCFLSLFVLSTHSVVCFFNCLFTAILQVLFDLCVFRPVRTLVDTSGHYFVFVFFGLMFERYIYVLRLLAVTSGP